jgi:SMODS and SLOG-associating 2TM effector domain family 5
VLALGFAALRFRQIRSAQPATTQRPRLYKDVALAKTLVDPAIEQYALYLISKCDTTASCQFEASRRMQKKNMTSTLSIVILSMYAILFSLMPTFDRLKLIQANKDTLSMISIFMSVFIIAFSLYEILKRYDLRSILFLKTARELQVLRDRTLGLKLAGDCDLKKYVEIENSYHEVLNSNDENHSRLDYETFRVGRGEIVGLKALEIQILRIATVWLVPFLALLAPLIIAYLYVYVVGSLTIFNPNGGG